MTMLPLRTTRVMTTDLAITAAHLVKLAHLSDMSLHRAVERAAPRLVELPWRVTDGVLEIASVSNPTEFHKCDDTFCSCPTKRGICWHVGAWHCISAIAATGVDVVAGLPMPERSTMVPTLNTYDDVDAIAALLTAAADLWELKHLTPQEAIRTALRVRLMVQPADAHTVIRVDDLRHGLTLDRAPADMSRAA